MWKKSIIVPIPKKINARQMNDFRPISLTSLLMKCFESIIKIWLVEHTSQLIHPLQFAYYRRNRSVEDATLILLNFIYKHVDIGKRHARLLFIDFSSAFNTSQPIILAERLLSEFDVPKGLVAWILDFLTRRSQIVRVNGEHSLELYSSVGGPQGCVLSPLLFILYTDRCRSQYPDRHIIKYADDTVVLSLLKQGDTEHGPILNNILDWCEFSFTN